MARLLLFAPASNTTEAYDAFCSCASARECMKQTLSFRRVCENIYVHFKMSVHTDTGSMHCAKNIDIAIATQ